MIKVPKLYIFVRYDKLTGRKTETRPLQLNEAHVYFEYTLECGQAYEHEAGNKKINRIPKTIKSMITNLNNAAANRARNGIASDTYSFKEFKPE